MNTSIGTGTGAGGVRRERVGVGGVPISEEGSSLDEEVGRAGLKRIKDRVAIMVKYSIWD